MRWPATFFVATALISSSALAQPTDANKAEGARLFEEGRALAKDGKYPEACERFTKSYELDRAVGTELNLADCDEHLGHLAEAWRKFDDAAIESQRTTNAERTKLARDRADALLPKLALVVVRLADPAAVGLTVSIAGRDEKPAAEIREHVEPGAIEVRASVPGSAPFAHTEAAVAGATVAFDIPAAGASIESTEPPRQHNRVYIAYGVAGLGAVTLVTSFFVALKAHSEYQDELHNGDCTKTTVLVCNTAGVTAVNHSGSVANAATYIGIIGLVLGGAGAAVYFTAPREVLVTPTATSQSVGVTLSARF